MTPELPLDKWWILRLTLGGWRRLGGQGSKEAKAQAKADQQPTLHKTPPFTNKWMPTYLYFIEIHLNTYGRCGSINTLKCRFRRSPWQ